MTILLFKLDRLKDIFSNLSLNITTIAIILKFANILFRRRNILDVNSWVHQLDTRATSADEQECLRSAIHTARKMFHVTCTMFTGAVILGELGALLSHEKTLDVSNDTFPAIYMLVLTAHVKTLNIRIRRLGVHVTESWQATNEELRQCIKDQQMLVEYFHTVRKVTSAAIFVQFFVTGMEACITAVCVFCVEGNLFELMFLGEYFFCVILEIFLYCYFGDELVHESGRITEAIYSCNRMDQNRSFKRNLVIFMQSTQESMTIIAGGIFSVNLSTFVSVLKSSYSLFALLMSMT
ncbi:unnamed protein product [Hermetia illucens]|uniref:Odorant receptor n=2 Tax=Hermetia illucens TaxID=343691 RepID=A0A7R8URQ7_HERIL|nr:unnamed protein product [Hermetia illucens]